MHYTHASHRRSGRGTPERDARRNLNAMSPLFQFHGPLGAPFPSCCSALWSVRACVDAIYHLIEPPPPPGLGTWSRPPAGSSSRGCYMLTALRESAVSGLHPGGLVRSRPPSDRRHPETRQPFTKALSSYMSSFRHTPQFRVVSLLSRTPSFQISAPGTSISINTAGKHPTGFGCLDLFLLSSHPQHPRRPL